PEPRRAKAELDAMRPGGDPHTSRHQIERFDPGRLPIELSAPAGVIAFEQPRIAAALRIAVQHHPFGSEALHLARWRSARPAAPTALLAVADESHRRQPGTEPLLASDRKQIVEERAFVAEIAPPRRHKRARPPLLVGDQG